MTTPRNDPLRSIGLLMEAANLADELRRLCRPADEGGAGQYMRLDVPKDYEPRPHPVIAVPVTAIEDLLERMIPVRIVTFDEVYQYVPGTTGPGKSNILGPLLARLVAMARTPGVAGLNKPRVAKPDHT